MREVWTAEIPAGYRKLQPDEIKQEGDRVWFSSVRMWNNIVSPGNRVGERQTVIRKIDESHLNRDNDEYGSW